MGQSITLNNTGDGGSVLLILNKVSSYVQVGVTYYPPKKIPGKTSPTIDTDTYTLETTRYRLTAFGSDANKVAMQLMRAQPQRQVKLTDGELSNVNVRLVRAEARANPGHVDANPDQYPWTLVMELEAEDH